MINKDKNYRDYYRPFYFFLIFIKTLFLLLFNFHQNFMKVKITESGEYLSFTCKRSFFM